MLAATFIVLFCDIHIFLQQQQQQKRYISASKRWELLNAQAMSK